MEDVGTRNITIGRTGWKCNLCGHMTFTNKIKHKCRHAPHFLSTRYEEYIVTKEQQNKIKKYIKKLLKKEV